MGDLTISGVTSKAYFVPQAHWIFMAVQARLEGKTRDKAGSKHGAFPFSREWSRDVYNQSRDRTQSG